MTLSGADLLRDVVRLVKCPESDVRSACLVGSRVYGCAAPDSDVDVLVVRAGGRPDLLFRPGLNVSVHSIETFDAALLAHRMFALEGLFAPNAAILKVGVFPPFRLNRARLVESAMATSESDWNKATRLWEAELEASQKKVYHAIRVLLFAGQILRQGRITEFGEANPVWAAARESLEWEAFVPLRSELLQTLRDQA